MGSMTDFDIPADAVAFTPAVQAIQTRLGTRRRNAALIWPAVITRDLADFIARQRSIFLGTASADGQPYLQHRGGAPGFLKVIDHSTLGMVDLPGNGQFITLGHLSENDRVLIFLIDFSTRQRVKIWGRARVTEDPKVVASLAKGVAGRAPRALLISVTAWDVNCAQHIPLRPDLADLRDALAERDAQIRQLRTEIMVLEQQLAVRDVCGDDL